MNTPMWEDPKDELRFAWAGVRHSYKELCNADLTCSGITDAKRAADRAMERLDRAIASALDGQLSNERR